MGKFDRMDDPTIYAWMLDGNSTRYDYPRAWPSADALHVQFAVLATVNAVVAAGVLVFLIAFWRSPAVYGNNFNLYLWFIALPDFLVSFFCLLTCAMSAPQRAFFSERMCGFQAFYLCWAFASNAWLNGVITYQVHKLLTQSNVRMRYKPPTKKLICIQAGAVYLYAAFWGCINSFGAGIHADFPHQSHLYYGFACHGMEHDKSSAFFFWLCFIPLYMGIPLCYACYVMFDIWYRGLLPPSGRRRNISIFLLRLCFLYFVIWFPYLLLSLIGNFVIVNNWLLWSGAAASHLQGLISVAFCMSNEDIYKAVWATVYCRSMDDDTNVRNTSVIGGILRLSRIPFIATSATGSATGPGSSPFNLASWRFSHKNSGNSGELKLDASKSSAPKLSHFSSEGGGGTAKTHMNAIEESNDINDIVDVEECNNNMMKDEDKEDAVGIHTEEENESESSKKSSTKGPLGGSDDDESDGSSHGHPSSSVLQNAPEVATSNTSNTEQDQAHPDRGLEEEGEDASSLPDSETKASMV